MGNETLDSSHYRSSGGSWAIVASPFASGGNALELTKVGSATVNVRIAANRDDGRPNGEFGIATAYLTTEFRVGSAPPSAEETITEFTDTGASTKASVTITSTRVLKIYNNSGGLVQTGSTVLALNTDYVLSFKVSTGSGNTPYEVLINGVSELSGSLNSLTGNHGSIYLGTRSNLNAQGMVLYFDNTILDDAAYVYGQIKRIGPTANSTPADFTSGTGSSDYTQVDEIQPSTADYIQSPASPSGHYVELEDCSTVGISGTIVAFKAQIMAREVTSGTSSNRLAIKSGATTVYTDAYNHTTSNQHIFKIAETDPNTGVAWTTAGIDALKIGIDEANSIAIRCMYMAGFVLFAPSVGGTPDPHFFSII